MRKKGQAGVSALIPLGITLVVLAIVLSLGQQILGDRIKENFNPASLGLI